jgi:hypothetical protein
VLTDSAGVTNFCPHHPGATNRMILPGQSTTVEQQLAQVMYDVCSFDATVRAAALSTHFSPDTVLPHPAVIVKGRQRVGQLYHLVARVCHHNPVVRHVHVVGSGTEPSTTALTQLPPAPKSWHGYKLMPAARVSASAVATTTAKVAAPACPEWCSPTAGWSAMHGPMGSVAHRTPPSAAASPSGARLLRSRTALMRLGRHDGASSPAHGRAAGAFCAATKEDNHQLTAIVHVTQRLRPYVLSGVMLTFPVHVVVRFACKEGCGTVVIQQQQQHVDVNGLRVHLPWKLGAALPVTMPLQLVMGWALIALVSWLDWLLSVIPLPQFKAVRR